MFLSFCQLYKGQHRVILIINDYTTSVVRLDSIIRFISFTDPSDFTASTIEPLTFGSGSTRECATIVIMNDTVLENSEEFSVLLSTADSDVDLGLTSASVTIGDDDRELS